MSKGGIAKRSALAHKKVADEKWACRYAACRRRLKLYNEAAEESNAFTPTQGGDEDLTSRVK
jgi:hypothetical protein